MAKINKTTIGILAVAGTLVGKQLGREKGNGLNPRYPDFTPEDFNPEYFEAFTKDGVVLRGKRYPNAGAVPLILIAGILGNGYQYDLAFEDCNFALYFARRGYDVWICNLRGTGKEPNMSDGGDFSHCIQDKGIYDVPALIEHVTEATGKKPVLVGHSMGSVVSFVYLLGLSYSEMNGYKRIKPDLELSREHNASISAHVSIGGPICFRWPRDDWHYWILETPVARLVLRGVRAMIGWMGRWRLRVQVEKSVVGLIGSMPRLGPMLLKPGFAFFANMSNMSGDTYLETLLSGLSDISFQEAYQFIDAALTNDFMECKALLGDFPGEPCNYTANAHLVEAPILFVTGELDPVHPETVYDYAFKKVSSEVKDFSVFDEFGHLDLLLGLRAKDEVFPYIADWLDRTLGVG
jgi:pimeloyl-ACP methyl ester carboxylesterase